MEEKVIFFYFFHKIILIYLTMRFFWCRILGTLVYPLFSFFTSLGFTMYHNTIPVLHSTVYCCKNSPIEKHSSSSFRVLGAGFLRLQFGAIALLLVLMGTSSLFAEDPIIRYNSSGTQQSSGTNLGAVGIGYTDGDVIKISADASATSVIKANNSGYTLTIQSDTPGVVRTITQGTNRTLDSGNDVTGINVFKFEDIKFSGPSNSSTQAAFHHSNRPAIVYQCDNVTFDRFWTSYRAAIIRVGEYLGISADAEALFKITGTYTFSNNKASQTAGVMRLERNVSNIPAALFAGDGSVGIFTGNQATSDADGKNGNDVYARYASNYVQFQDAGTYSFDGGLVVPGAININEASVTLLGRATDTTITTKSYTSCSGFNVVNGGKLIISSAENQYHTVVGKIDLGNATDGSGDLVLNITSGSQAFANIISGTGNLTKSGDGYAELSAANTYTGTTTVSGGTLAITGTTASSDFAVASGATLDVSGMSGSNTHILSAVENVISGTIAGNGNTTLSIPVAHDNKTTFSSAVSGVTQITKTGAGTLQMNYQDGISVAKISVIDSGQLDMKGFLIGDLEVEGTFSPGNSIGKLTQEGNYTQTGTLLLEVGAVDGQFAYDELLVTGSVSFDTDSVIQLAWDGTLPAVAGSYDLVTATGGITYTSDFNWSTILTDAGFDTAKWSLTGGTNAITLSYSDVLDVPEPSTWALLILGTVGLLLFKRRK